MHPLVRLAKKTVEAFVRRGEIFMPKRLTPEMKQQAGVFVSIHKGEELRGCIGTFEPQHHNVALEIVANALGSASHDPRFSPVTKNELRHLSYSIDVLSPPQRVTSLDQLDPKRYGVIVEAGWRKGLLLPDLEGVNSVEEQVGICRLKAGLEPDEPVTLYRFEVKRYS
jgi:AmmeMemoRadiSam system protein A